MNKLDVSQRLETGPQWCGPTTIKQHNSRGYLMNKKQPNSAIRLGGLGALTVLSTIFGISGTTIPAFVHITCIWIAILALTVIITTRSFEN